MEKKQTKDRTAQYSRKEIGKKYELRERLGQGGGGQVFRVYDRKLDKFWAAKKIKRSCPGMEGRALGRVDDGAFPRIVDVVEEEDCRYLIMDWIEGETLEERLKRNGPFSVQEAVKTGLALCEALEALHALQPPLLYLDCKPSNLMLDKDGRLRLVDLGSVVEAGELDAEPIAASAGYAAPEQLTRDRLHRRVDVRTDVFGLGRTLYALLSGRDPARPPYMACRLQDCNRAIPVKLAEIVEKCMQRDPERRYQTVRGVREALLAWEDGRHRKGFFPWRHWQLYYEPRQSVLRTRKSPGRWLFLLAAAVGALALTAQTVQAALPPEQVPWTEAMLPPVMLRDCSMRKLLIREGAALKTARKVYLELDPKQFTSGSQWKIRMTGVTRDAKQSWEYVLYYCPE